MTTFARLSLLTILAVALAPAVAGAKQEGISAPMPVCQLPIMKSYYIQKGFCPQHLAISVPQCVPADGPVGACGSYGIPPIYSAGRYLMVRQTPENQARIARYLTEIGAYVVPTIER